MKTITIKVNTIADEKIILLLAKRLDCKIISHPESKLKKKESTHKALQHLKKIAESGGLKNVIPDPVQWQKDLRKDRPLDRK